MGKSPEFHAEPNNRPCQSLVFFDAQKWIKRVRMLEEVFAFGGDVSGLFPPNVLKRLRSRMGASG